MPSHNPQIRETAPAKDTALGLKYSPSSSPLWLFSLLDIKDGSSATLNNDNCALMLGSYLEVSITLTTLKISILFLYGRIMAKLQRTMLH